MKRLLKSKIKEKVSLFYSILLFLSCAFGTNAYCQTTTNSNNFFLPGSFLGWESGATGPSDDLELGHENPNQPVIFSIAQELKLQRRR
jgi:hypothetical protein